MERYALRISITNTKDMSLKDFKILAITMLSHEISDMNGPFEKALVSKALKWKDGLELRSHFGEEVV